MCKCVGNPKYTILQVGMQATYLPRKKCSDAIDVETFAIPKGNRLKRDSSHFFLRFFNLWVFWSRLPLSYEISSVPRVEPKYIAYVGIQWKICSESNRTCMQVCRYAYQKMSHWNSVVAVKHTSFHFFFFFKLFDFYSIHLCTEKHSVQW